MKLAAFGGVYGNPRALVAVLEDARARGAERVQCLGDLGGFGPDPDGAIEVLRAANVPCVRGNLDDSVGHDRNDCACGYSDPRDLHFSQLSYEFAAARTSARHKPWLKALPEHERFEHAGRRVLLCHGSPRRVNEFLWESTCADAFLEWLCAAHGAEVLVCAHTGIPWHRALPSGRRVVNVGAVGRPAHDGRPGAWYAEVEVAREVRVVLRHVAYDHEAVASEVEGVGLPAEFAATLRSGWWTTCLENLPAKERARGPY